MRRISPESARERLRAALDESDGNVSRAARALGLPRSTLRYRLRCLDVR